MRKMATLLKHDTGSYRNFWRPERLDLAKYRETLTYEGITYPARLTPTRIHLLVPADEADTFYLAVYDSHVESGQLKTVGPGARMAGPRLLAADADAYEGTPSVVARIRHAITRHHAARAARVAAQEHAARRKALTRAVGEAGEVLLQAVAKGQRGASLDALCEAYAAAKAALDTDGPTGSQEKIP